MLLTVVHFMLNGAIRRTVGRTTLASFGFLVREMADGSKSGG